MEDITQLRLAPQAQVRNKKVKVSMDGDLILKRINLSLFKGYTDLGLALDNLFHCNAIGTGEYVVAYLDTDNDWMLVGDLPWLMFKETCKRLRILKPSVALCGFY